MQAGEQYAASGGFDLGPHHRDPWFLLFAVSQFGIQVLVQVNKSYRLGRKEELRALWLDTQLAYSQIVVDRATQRR